MNESRFRFRAWHTELCQMYFFDIRWGNTWQEGAGYIGMVPFSEGLKRIGFCRDNKELISPGDVIFMQSTGLKDCNDILTFGGDIVNVKRILHDKKWHVCEILWSEVLMGFHYRGYYNGKKKNSYYGILPQEIDHSKTEKIGTIYENPELLDMGSV